MPRRSGLMRAGAAGSPAPPLLDPFRYVATENDSVYAFDADTGTELWQVSVLGPGEVPSDPLRGSLTPVIGITATPVIDLSTDTMYVVAMSKLVSGNSTTYIQRIHALDITTGADKVAPTSIDQSITDPGAGPGGNGTDVIFNPTQYEDRDALLLVNVVVYTGRASHGDNAPYTGWIIGFNANDLSLAPVLNIDPNGAPTSSFLDVGSGNTCWNSHADDRQ
jgi:outer membrane protein assembly factor BamB